MKLLLLLLLLVACSSLSCSSSGCKVKPRAGVSIQSDKLAVPGAANTTLSVGFQIATRNDLVIVADYEFPASEMRELRFGTLKTGLRWRF